MAIATPTALKPSEINVVEDFNPRTEMDKKKLDELAASIKQDGIIQPLVVAEADEKGKHQLIAGHRRFAAAKRIKLRELPVVVRSVNGDAKALAVIENLQREDLNPIDEANGFAQVMEAEGIKSQKELAERLGVSTSQVSDRLKMLKLHPDVQELFKTGELPASVAGFVEKAQRVNEVFAYAIAEVLAHPHDNELWSTDLGDLEDASDVINAAWNLIESGDFPADLGECTATSNMMRSTISSYSFRIAWPQGSNKVKKDLSDWQWQPSWTDQDRAAARQFGCLFEHKCKSGGETVTLQIACDAEFVFGLLEQKHEAWTAGERKKREAEKQAPKSKDPEAERRKKEAAEERAQITKSNADFTARFQQHRGDIQVDLDAAKAMIASTLGLNQTYSASLAHFFALTDPVMEDNLDKYFSGGNDRAEVAQLLNEYVMDGLNACTTIDEVFAFGWRAHVAGAGLHHPRTRWDEPSFDELPEGLPDLQDLAVAAGEAMGTGTAAEVDKDQLSIDDAQPAAE